MKKQSMIGKFFHTYETQQDGVKWLVYQGRILARPSASMYLVQRYEFMWGEPIDRVLTPLSKMDDWKFYDTHKDWHEAYENYSRNCERRERSKVQAVGGGL